MVSAPMGRAPGGGQRAKQRRRLGPRFGGDGVGALAPKIFCRPPQIAKFRVTAGDSLSLGTIMLAVGSLCDAV